MNPNFQDLIPPQNESLQVNVETFIFEISKIGEWLKFKPVKLILHPPQDDISLTMTFELYLDLTWRETRIIINDTHPAWGASDAVMGSTNFIPHMWLPDIQVSKDGCGEEFGEDGGGDDGRDDDRYAHNGGDEDRDTLDGGDDGGDDDRDAHDSGDNGGDGIGDFCVHYYDIYVLSMMIPIYTFYFFSDLQMQTVSSTSNCHRCGRTDNFQEQKRKYSNTPRTYFNISHHQVLYTVSTEVIIVCPMNFAAYPLDHQICKFRVSL